MKTTITSNEIQRNDFIKNLYEQIKVTTKKEIAEHERFASIANHYMEDGLEPEECVELLIVDGLDRDAAAQYVDMAFDCKEASEALDDYTFTFEDSRGRVWSSCDVNIIIKASCEDDAWQQAEDMITSSDNLEIESVISVEKML